MARTKKFKKPSKNQLTIDCIKTAKKQCREVELLTASGFISSHKVFKSQKDYSRKSKHKLVFAN
jgi:hypothetical protein